MKDVEIQRLITKALHEMLKARWSIDRAELDMCKTEHARYRYTKRAWLDKVEENLKVADGYLSRANTYLTRTGGESYSVDTSFEVLHDLMRDYAAMKKKFEEAVRKWEKAGRRQSSE